MNCIEVNNKINQTDNTNSKYSHPEHRQICTLQNLKQKKPKT